MEKTHTPDPEKGILQLSVPHDEDKGRNIEEMPCKIGLYNAVINELENFTVEGDVLCEVTYRGNTILHVAAKSGSKEIAKKIIDKDSLLLLECNSKGNTPLHTASSLGNLEMIEYLLQCAEEKKEDIEKHTPFVPLLRITNYNMETALHAAVRHGHYKIVKLLIKKDPFLTSLTNKDGESPLFMAVDAGFFDIAEHILDSDIKECSYGGCRGMNVLHAAAIRVPESNMFKHSTHDAVSFLRDARSSLNDHLFALRDSFYLTKIFDQRKKLKITKEEFVRKILKEFPKKISESDDFGWTPLHYAAHFGEIELVKLFLGKENSLAYIKDKEGMCALHVSAKEGHVEVMKIFIEECPYACELLDNRSRTALHLAAENGKTEAVNVFVRKSAFKDLMNEQDDEGNTPLHLAAKNGHYAVLMTLAEVRTVEGNPNNAGETILDIIDSDDKLMSNEKNIIRSYLKRHNFLRKLEKRVDRPTAKEQIPKTRRHGQSIQETVRKEPAEGSSATHISEDDKKAKEDKQDDIKDMANFNLLVATIIATVTFAAAFKVPGGYNNNGLAILSEGNNKKAKKDKQDDIKDMANFNLLVVTIIATVTFAAAFQVPGGYNDNGLAILSKDNIFTNFLIYDSLAFGFSSVSIFANFAYPFLAKATRVTYPIMFSLVLTELSVICMVVAFVEGTKAVLAEKSWLPNVVYASLIPITYFLLRPIIVRKTFLYSDKTGALPWYL